MTDPNPFIPQLVQFLAPFLPYLLKAGEKAAEEAGKKLGEAAWERAKGLWGKLKRNERIKRAAETNQGICVNLTGDAQKPCGMR